MAQVIKEPVFVKSIKFQNFKSFESFKIDFEDINILVGINNSGKSSILLGVKSCFNFLADLVKERDKLVNEDSRAAVDISYLHLPDVRDAWYNKRQRTSAAKIIPVIFTIEFSNGLSFEIHLRQFYGQPHISIQNLKDPVKREQVMEILKSNPVLIPGFVGALVQEEYKTSQSINRTIAAGRHTEILRNVLFQLKNNPRFKILNDIIQKYFGVNLSKIAFDETIDEYVTTLYNEKGIELDIGLAGSGFLQMLQLLTFVLNQKSNIVLLDEPDAHLHPSLQKILIEVLSDLNKKEKIQFILSTHSKEIVSQADPRKIIFIDNANNEGKRLASVPELLDVIGKLGSIDHIDLAMLFQTKRCLFVEGSDFRVLHQFATTLNLNPFQGNKQVVPISRGGHSNLRYYDDLTVFRNFIGHDLKGYSIMDRDYRPQDLVDQIIDNSNQQHVQTHVWERHEIENYLLEPTVLERILNEKLKEKGDSRIVSNVKDIILQCANEYKQTIEDSISDALVFWAHQKKQSIEPSTANKQAREITAQSWTDWNSLIKIMPGKEILHCLKGKIQTEYGISLSNVEISSKMKESEINEEIKTVLTEIFSL